MRILSLLIYFAGLFFFNQKTDSPHGTEFKISCKTCHSTKGWQLDKEIYSFDHNTTELPLVGQHKVVDCRQCHVSLIFSDAKTECNECHNDIHQATVGPDCSKCHNPSSWLVNNINEIHQMSRFPLVGAHRTADCSQCHRSESLARFDVPGVNCIDCHRENYMASTNPNHIISGISEDCIQCHPLNSFQWAEAGFNHNVFPLELGHSMLKCSDCHKSTNFADAKSDCYSCHQQNFAGAKNPDHLSAQFSVVCTDCHTIGVGWKPAKFDHTVFPLTLGHAGPSCTDCHKDGNYTSTSPECYSCHQQNFLATTNPNHSNLGFPTSCTICHTVVPGWKPTSFNHSSFPLTLGHSTPACVDCHKGGNYSSTSPFCYSCHQQNFTTASNPNHISAGFTTECATCHTLDPGWKPAAFNHTTFPLTLGHAGQSCVDCHKGGNYASTSPECYSCHQQNFTAATDPNHITAGFPTNCTTCHTTNPGWKPVTFNHVSFPLTLGHSTPACADCHKGGNYTSTSPDCNSCHQQNYISTVNPNHTSAGFSQVCQTCHTLNPGWKPATFNHSSFPLTQGHSLPTCIDCHTGENYKTIPIDCYSCHQQNYAATTNPNHLAAGFPTNCTQCHSINPGWKPTTFDHSSFPLTLGHSIPGCADCHKGNYTSLSSDCYSCHQQNYTSSTNPNHIAGGFPTNCAQCHSTNIGWKPSSYNHGSFPLTLGHSIPTCVDCHKGNYTTTSPDCYSCHQQNYTSSTNPNHIAGGFPTSCAQCHSTNIGWKPSTYNHGSFPLTLGHSIPACIDCHKGNYTTTSPDCYSCHQQNYTSTTNPNHSTSGIPTTCATCHSTNPGWTPATFNHTTFPLTLGHATPTCADCHKGNYTTTSTDCYVCHVTDYNNTVNPNHRTLSFATTCLTCHTTNPGWKPALYTQHDSQFFPIYSGRHQGKWTVCTDCHTNPANYSLFTCITCHNKSDMDSSHNGRTGYSYDSAACLRCHPRGSAD
jgi:predicted CXXCH cytochrome family protein